MPWVAPARPEPASAAQAYRGRSTDTPRFRPLSRMTCPVEAAGPVVAEPAEVAEAVEHVAELGDLLVVLGLRDAARLEVGVEARGGGRLHRRLDLGERLAVRLGDGFERLAVTQLRHQGG